MSSESCAVCLAHSYLPLLSLQGEVPYVGKAQQPAQPDVFEAPPADYEADVDARLFNLKYKRPGPAFSPAAPAAAGRPAQPYKFEAPTASFKAAAGRPPANQEYRRPEAPSASLVPAE